jgi:hypothetical protein
MSPFGTLIFRKMILTSEGPNQRVKPESVIRSLGTSFQAYQ